VFNGILYRQFGRGQLCQFEFLKFFKPYTPLALAGLFYNLGIWSDKFIFWWFSPIQVHVAGILYAAPVYDMAVYLSFLSLVPGLAIFLVNLETDYAIKCERFIQRILGKATLNAITGAKEELVGSLQRGLEKLVKVQVLCTGCLIVFAEELLSLLNLGMVETGIFQVVMLGAFMLMIYLVFLTISFYLHRLRAACWSCVIFFLTNTTVTSFNVLANERWYGVGFVAAGCVAAAFAAVCVRHYHQNLEYYTFTEQIRG
jgi:uncharacterized membrane protein